MKKLLVIVLVVFLFVMLISCNNSSKNGSDVTMNEQKSVSIPISNSVYESDGIIEPLDQNSLVTKLSGLKKDMSLDDIIALFGKEPFIIKESGASIFVYYSGDITITLWGTSLYQAIVEYNDSAVMIALGNDIPLV